MHASAHRVAGAGSAPYSVVVLLLALALSAGGCGSSPESPLTQPSAAAQQCRDQWKALGDSLRGRDQQPDPSDLAQRWASALATVDYYTTSATAGDCPGPLADQRTADDRIQQLSARLRPFDISYQMSDVAPIATDYLLAPTPQHGRHGKHQPPTKSQVRRALATLQTQAAASVSDMHDGWTEASTVDLTDPAAVDKVVSDLSFLAGDSAPFQSCLAALRVLRRLQTAAGAR
ncbi:hypothetical protein [Nocardioides terrisoli]|uniref:hypothetical protein n=1 Tax=Nocardioides terrisoli TaxID=3388267 RepID=UPI00287B6296|nr:hypothetical protein [Nocardioides marmorisolisilvae]